MRVLQVCGRVPFPPADGGTLAVNNITQGLISQGCTVNVFALNTKKHWVDVEQLSPSYRKALLDTIAINTNIKPTDALLNLFGTQSYHVTRFFSTKAQERLIELLQKQQFDIIHVEGLFMSVYLTAIRNNTKAPVVLRAHNIEYKIWEHMAANERKPAKRLYLKLLAKRLKAYEKKAINQFDAVVTITQADADHYKELGCIKPLYVCPFGVDSNSLKRTGISREFPSLFHLGAMDWLPNKEGVHWFLKEVWPQVNKQLPGLKLYLAGRNMKGSLPSNIPSGVEVVGEVSDAYDFMASKAIMIVPLSSGSGMRVKIVEGMTMQNTIISTPIGADGIDYQDGEHLVIANSASDFANKIIQYANDKELSEGVGRKAKELVNEKYDLNVLAEGLVNLYKSLPA